MARGPEVGRAVQEIGSAVPDRFQRREGACDLTRTMEDNLHPSRSYGVHHGRGQRQGAGGSRQAAARQAGRGSVLGHAESREGGCACLLERIALRRNHFVVPPQRANPLYIKELERIHV